MIDTNILEKLDFDKQNGLIPTIVQDIQTKEVLMLAYMSKESLQYTLENKIACYFSRSRMALWIKGETSGHFQHVLNIAVDCDCDTILLMVKQDGVACHTGAYSCFFNTLYEEENI